MVSSTAVATRFLGASGTPARRSGGQARRCAQWGRHNLGALRQLHILAQLRHKRHAAGVPGTCYNPQAGWSALRFCKPGSLPRGALTHCDCTRLSAPVAAHAIGVHSPHLELVPAIQVGQCGQRHIKLPLGAADRDCRGRIGRERAGGGDRPGVPGGNQDGCLVRHRASRRREGQDRLVATASCRQAGGFVRHVGRHSLRLCCHFGCGGALAQRVDGSHLQSIAGGGSGGRVA